MNITECLNCIIMSTKTQGNDLMLLSPTLSHINVFLYNKLYLEDCKVKWYNYNTYVYVVMLVFTTEFKNLEKTYILPYSTPLQKSLLFYFL